MDAKKLGFLALAGLVFSPIALALGLVLLVAALSDDDKGAPGADMDLTAAGSLKVGPGAVPARYAPLITDAAASCDQGLSPGVVAAQLQQESGFNPRAKSPAGAQGIAQFMPGTWQTWKTDGNGDGKMSVWEPADAIPAQAKFMCSLLRQAKESSSYQGTPTELALAGYNAGWGRVQQYKGVPPQSFAKGETYNYVRTIMSNVAKLTATPSGDGEWSLPVNGPLGASYGQSGSAWSSGQHTGVDFTVPTGTPVKSVGSGTVVSAGRAGAYGNEVIVRHPDGVYSQYAHLANLTVAKGDKVKGGQQVGQSGSTGNSTGPHLHLEIRTTAKYGSDIAPIPYLRKQGLSI